MTIASWGGSYQEAQSKALFEPAAANTGIEVKQETYGGMSDVRLAGIVGAGDAGHRGQRIGLGGARRRPRACWKRSTTT